VALETNNDFILVFNDAYEQGNVAVGTTEIELKVGGSRLEGRELLRVENTSDETIYVGPTGVTAATGIPVEVNNWLELCAGPDLAVYAIAGAGNNNVRVSELA